MGRSSKDQRDIHYRLAKEKGYRARSAFKLLQCDELYGLFQPNTRRVIDLCAAPGSWSQVIVERLLQLANDETTAAADDRLPRLVSVDLQSVAPIHPICTILKADITLESTLQRIARALYGVGAGEDANDFDLDDPNGKADLVVCDGAPDVTGTHDLDAHLQQQLLTAALTMACCALRSGGTFVAKVFVKPGRDTPTPALVTQMRCLFHRVTLHKPPSSRSASWEQFVICQGYLPPHGYRPTLAGGFFTTYDRELIDSGTQQRDDHPRREGWKLNSFVATGDLSSFDAPVRRKSSLARSMAQAAIG